MNLRDKIIFILETNRGSYISGQSIAQSCGVSRNAISKCVNSLKDEGYIIDSVNNLGHRLDPSCDILSESGIRAHLDEECAVKVFSSIDSTNSEAKRTIDTFQGDAILASCEQTAGRGRRGRSFYSPNGGGLYFSCVLHPDVSLSDATAITSAAAVAVCESIAEITSRSPKIKWVNDLFIDGKKVCGILTEAVSDFESGRVQAVIVGIGINLTTEIFPEEIRDIAASVGVSVNKNALIASIFKRLKALCATLPDKSFMELYRDYSLVLGRDINFERNQVKYKAKAVAINDDGSLEVVTENGEKMLLNSGEISIKL